MRHLSASTALNCTKLSNKKASTSHNPHKSSQQSRFIHPTDLTIPNPQTSKGSSPSPNERTSIKYSTQNFSGTMKSYSALISALALSQCTTATLARSSHAAPSIVGTKPDSEFWRQRKNNSANTIKKQSSYDVLEMLDEGLMLIQGLLARGESLPNSKANVETYTRPGQNLEWNLDVRTNVELNMMGI